MSTDEKQSSLNRRASKKRIPIRTACAARLLPLVLLLVLALPAAVQAQDYTYTTNDGTITITGYTGPGGAVAIPDTINDLPVTSIGGSAFYEYTNLTSITFGTNVTSIGEYAFYNCTNLTSITFGTNITSIGEYAFYSCTSLTNVTIPNSVTNIGGGTFQICENLTSITFGTNVTSIGDGAFSGCIHLTSVRIPDSVTSIGNGAFTECIRLTSVTIGNGVTSIADYAFYHCTNLTRIFFQGDAPGLGGASVFAFDNNATVYYLPETTGWTNNPWNGRPIVEWRDLQVQTGEASFGVRTNRFGFVSIGTSNLVIVVEACTNLANPAWSPLQTNTLTDGSFYFSDPRWTNYHARFYRLWWP